MSTKIYYAYRISKKVDILDLFDKIRLMAERRIARDEKLLYCIHAISVMEAAKRFEKDPGDYFAKRVVEGNEKNIIDDIWTEKILEEYSRDDSKLRAIDLNFTCSVFYDSKYWYLRFYPNTRWMQDVLSKAEKKFKLEDYHYQNSTDPPSNISYEKYKKRDKKWEELCKGNNYTRGLLATIYSPSMFRELLSENYYKGKKTNKELFAHLAYKFDKKQEMLKKEKNN